MASPDPAATKHMSGPAAALAAELAAAPVRDLTRETAVLLREEGEAAYRPRAERALAGSGVTVRERQIAGVPCLELIPARHRETRTVFYCYGGGCVAGSAYLDLIISAPIAAATGARVIAPDYRLAPENPYPAAIDDCFAVYEAVLGEVPGEGLVVSGESAGGNMALGCLHRGRAKGLPMPTGAALLSPWSDLAGGDESSAFNDGRDPTLSRENLLAAAMLYAGERALTDPGVSPLLGPFDASYPPMLITSGTRDLLLSQCIRLAEVLRAARVPVELQISDGMWHVFEYYDELPEARRSLGEIAEFIDRRFSANGR
ncbi:MAG: alpha/beta hydrolase [Hyphomicrobiaceae bacterium]